MGYPKIIAVSTLATGFLVYIWHYSYWSRRHVKQRYQLSIFGDTYKHFFKLSAYHDVIEKLYQRFPCTRYIGFYHYLRPGLMIRDPELIKQICITDKEYFPDRNPILSDKDKLWCKNVFALQGEQWREMRGCLSPLFTGAKMREFFDIVDEYAKNFCLTLNQRTEDVVEIELRDLFTRFTTDIIASVAFGHEVDSLKEPDNEFYAKVKEAMLTTDAKKTFNLKLTLMFPFLTDVIGANFFNESVSKYFTDLVRKKIEERKKGTRRNDMLQLLMEVGQQNQDGVDEENGENQIPRFTVEDIASQALVFILGGFETASNALTFMTYELALNKPIQDRLIKEVDNYRRNHGILTYDGVQKLEYMDMVLRETLRKWPPLLVVDRKCVRNYTIPPAYVDERPLVIQKGTLIWVPVWAIHHDRKYWDDPHTFDPERFTELKKRIMDKGKYFPFGLGPRSCLGSRFAMMEIKMLMFEILSRFTIVKLDNSVVPFVPGKDGFNLSSVHGFHFGLKKRRRSLGG